MRDTKRNCETRDQPQPPQWRRQRLCRGQASEHDAIRIASTDRSGKGPHAKLAAQAGQLRGHQVLTTVAKHSGKARSQRHHVEIGIAVQVTEHHVRRPLGAGAQRTSLDQPSTIVAIVPVEPIRCSHQQVVIAVAIEIGHAHRGEPAMRTPDIGRRRQPPRSAPDRQPGAALQVGFDHDDLGRAVAGHIEEARGRGDAVTGELVRDFRCGTKVIHVKNNYEMGIFNGELGIVRAARPGATPRFDELDATPLPVPGGVDLVPIEAETGTVVLLHGALPHRSEANRSPRSRQAYTVHLLAPDAPYPADNWLQRPDALPLRGFGG